MNFKKARLEFDLKLHKTAQSKISPLTKMKTQYFSAPSFQEKEDIASVGLDMAMESGSEVNETIWKNYLFDAKAKLAIKQYVDEMGYVDFMTMKVPSLREIGNFPLEYKFSVDTGANKLSLKGKDVSVLIDEQGNTSIEEEGEDDNYADTPFTSDMTPEMEAAANKATQTLILLEQEFSSFPMNENDKSEEASLARRTVKTLRNEFRDMLEKLSLGEAIFRFNTEDNTDIPSELLQSIDNIKEVLTLSMPELEPFIMKDKVFQAIDKLEADIYQIGEYQIY